MLCDYVALSKGEKLRTIERTVQKAMEEFIQSYGRMPDEIRYLEDGRFAIGKHYAGLPDAPLWLRSKKDIKEYLKTNQPQN